MVAVMEVSEKDIETLRAGLNADNSAEGYGKRMFAHSILDRLSPAPEVDEATVWAGKILTLLAAKDAERDHLVEGVATLEAQLEQQKYELATLRAENERLRDE